MSNPHEAWRRTAPPDRAPAGSAGAKAAGLRSRKPQRGHSIAAQPAPDKAAALRTRARRTRPSG